MTRPRFARDAATVLSSQYFTRAILVARGLAAAALLGPARYGAWNALSLILEYGSYAPGAPNVFLDDAGFARLWSGSDRYYLVAAAPETPRFEKLVGKKRLRVVRASGGKLLFCNQPL